MTIGCFSGFWCCRQLPSPSDDAIEMPVLTPKPPSPSGNAMETPVPAPIPASSRFPTYLDPAEAKQHIDRIERFRILVMGRANAGKTTILQRVCNTTDQPEILDGQGQRVDAAVVQGSITRGIHNIEHELVFTSNPGFVFHDSCGFESGSEVQFEMMKKFVMDRAKTTKLDKRIHAIWFCIPLNDRHRMVTAAEMKFFDACDTGHVPVIVLLTKADTLSLDAQLEVEEQMENGFIVDNVMQYVTEVEGRLLNSALLKVKERINNQRFTPHDYLTLAGMDKEGADCTILIACTANALKEEGLQQLLISTQQSNLELCMEFAVMKALKNCMEKLSSKMGPNTLASILALWFPYKWFAFGQAFAEEEAAQQRQAAEAEAAFAAAKQRQAAEAEAAEEAAAAEAEAFAELEARFAYQFARQERSRQQHAREAREGFEALDDHLVPNIQQRLFNLRMPTLSNSMQYSFQYTAEQGIGAILVLEYLYFLLQVKDHRNNLQAALDLAVDKYQTSGSRESVCRLINEALQEHGENVEVLCPILLWVAKEKQMSRNMSNT